MNSRDQASSSPVKQCAAARTDFAVLDALNGSLLNRDYVEVALAAGIQTIHVTINNFGRINPYPSLRESLTALALLRRKVNEIEGAHLVRGGDDLEGQTGSLGVVLGYQNMPGVDRDLELLDLFRQLDVLIVQISHNARNHFADGCSEPADAQLSSLGVDAVERMNELGIVIDLSHTGTASSIDVLERSRHPVAITHSNAHVLAANVRNKPDAVLRALASNGGVIGICYLPPIVNTEQQPAKLDDVIRHIDYIAEAIGPQHIGIGSDFIEGQPPERYEVFMRHPEVYGTWPWRFAVEDLEAQNRLFEELLRRGYSETDVRGIAGENFRRLFRTVWSKRQVS